MAQIYVDETKRAGYVMAAVAVADADAENVRKEVRKLILPRQRQIHMHSEGAGRRRAIISALVTMPIKVTIYDAGRHHRTDLEARAACLTAIVEELAGGSGEIRLVIEPDASVVSFDNQRLIELTRATHLRGTLHYEHLRPQAEPLLALPDVVAWSWVRSGDWRRRITPILAAVRMV